MNQASPWIVNEEMVKKHSLPSKIADIFTASAMVRTTNTFLHAKMKESDDVEKKKNSIVIRNFRRICCRDISLHERFVMFLWGNAVR